MKAVALSAPGRSSDLATTFELVIVEVPLRLVKGRGAGELAYREGGQRFGLVGSAQRLAPLSGFEAVAFAAVNDQCHRDRADRDRGDDGETKPGNECAWVYCRRLTGAAQFTGAFARDSHR